MMLSFGGKLVPPCQVCRIGGKSDGDYGSSLALFIRTVHSVVLTDAPDPVQVVGVVCLGVHDLVVGTVHVVGLDADVVFFEPRFERVLARGLLPQGTNRDLLDGQNIVYAPIVFLRSIFYR